MKFIKFSINKCTRLNICDPVNKYDIIIPHNKIFLKNTKHLFISFADKHKNDINLNESYDYIITAGYVIYVGKYSHDKSILPKQFVPFHLVKSNINIIIYGVDRQIIDMIKFIKIRHVETDIHIYDKNIQYGNKCDSIKWVNDTTLLFINDCVAVNKTINLYDQMFVQNFYEYASDKIKMIDNSKNTYVILSHMADKFDMYDDAHKFANCESILFMNYITTHIYTKISVVQEELKIPLHIINGVGRFNMTGPYDAINNMSIICKSNRQIKKVNILAEYYNVYDATFNIHTTIPLEPIYNEEHNEHTMFNLMDLSKNEDSLDYHIYTYYICMKNTLIVKFNDTSYNDIVYVKYMKCHYVDNAMNITKKIMDLIYFSHTINTYVYNEIDA